MGFLNMESYNVGNVHPCLSTVDNTDIDVRRAVIKLYSDIFCKF